MMGAGPKVFAIWPYIIANADADGFVELNPKLMALLIGMTEEEVGDVIFGFLEPDAQSRTKRAEGRKLERVGEFMYRVVNFEKYQTMRTYEIRRAQNRAAAAKHRAKKKGAVLPKSTPLAGEAAAVKGYQNGTLDENFEPVKPPSETKVPECETKADSGLKVTRAFEE